MKSSYVDLEVEILSNVALVKQQLKAQAITYSEDFTLDNVVFITVSLSTEDMLNRNKNLIVNHTTNYQ